ERVIVDVQGSSERVKVRIEWIGGGHTEGVVIRPVGKLSELSTYPQICQQIQALTEAGWTATAIAQALTEAGYCPAHTTARFGAQTIRRLQRQLELKAPRPRVRQRDELGPDEWWPAELVRVLEIPRASLYHWIHQGLVRAHQLDEPLHRWVVWADEAEQERLRQYHKRAIGDDLRHRWTGV
ncbi:MAG: recombinase family protein, partial [Ktedonobacteraceae bacterium]